MPEPTLSPHAEAAVLRRQATGIRRRINAHGLGMRHGCDTGRSNYCEAWRIILADIEAEIRRLEQREGKTTLEVVEPDGKHIDNEAAQEAVRHEVMARFAAFRRKKVTIDKAGNRTVGVVLPERLNVPYDGPDATDAPAMVMGLPVTWSPQEKWGLMVDDGGTVEVVDLEAQ